MIDFINQAEEDEMETMQTLTIFGMYYDTFLNKRKRLRGPESGFNWVERNLADSYKCFTMFRMSRPLFHQLHNLLVHSYGLKGTCKSKSIEALAMFLWIVGSAQGVRQAENIFERSLDTVHRNFNKVLHCLVKLAADNIKPKDPEFRTRHERLNNPRFYPFFNDCIGAIDGTHIPIVVPSEKLVQYMCRKGCTTQNVMPVCDFDMRFTFVLAGWPGSVHDMRVFRDAMDKYGSKFPHPPPGTKKIAITNSFFLFYYQIIILTITFDCRKILPS